MIISVINCISEIFQIKMAHAQFFCFCLFLSANQQRERRPFPPSGRRLVHHTVVQTVKWSDKCPHLVLWALLNVGKCFLAKIKKSLACFLIMQCLFQIDFHFRTFAVISLNARCIQQDCIDAANWVLAH